MNSNQNTNQIDGKLTLSANIVRVVNHSKTLPLPVYETTGADGLDIMACFDCEYIEDGIKKIKSVIKYEPALYPIELVNSLNYVIESGAPAVFDSKGNLCTHGGFIKKEDGSYLPSEHKSMLSVNTKSIIKLYPGERALIPTNLSTSIDDTRRIHISSRSGLALKHGVFVLNSPGKVDSDYRGIIGVILCNHGNSIIEIAHGDKIAQMALEESIKLEFIQMDELDSTSRGSGGFGSTSSLASSK